MNEQSPVTRESAAKPKFPRLSSRAILLFGFGGMLVLLVYAGFGAVRNLTSIRRNNESIRHDFFMRNRVLNQIRSDVYLSGTYLRDYILEPEERNAEKHRSSLERTHADVDELLVRYASLIHPEELGPVTVLQRELTNYWHVADPALHWNADERRSRGYPFLRDEVLPRRASMLGIADRIDAVNEQQLTEEGKRVSSLFDAFRRRLIATFGVTLGLGLSLAAFSFYRVLYLERQAAVRYAEIVNARSELKELSARIVDTQESERRSISRELHDEVGQTLSALMVGLSNLNATLPRSASEETKNQIEALKRLAANTATVVRNMSLLLRPSMLDDLGLVPALQWQAREVSRQTGMRISIAAEDTLVEIPDAHKTCVYRLVQEALYNCSRHSAANTVRISVKCQDSRLRLSIQDDGKGFVVAHDKGLGLLGMQERVTGLGGEFQVKSEPGCGTLVAASLPMNGARDC